MSENKHTFTFAEDFVGYANIKVVGVGGGGGWTGRADETLPALF